MGTALGLGEGFTFNQDVVGAKVRLFANAVLDQDSWLPQVAIGTLYKKVNRDGLVQALGAEDDDGFDFYVSATKIFLAERLLANVTLRHTSAHQTGFLGFGPDASIQPEFSVGYLLSRKLVVGGEYRFKPNNLGFADEDDWFDVFVAYAPSPNVTLTAAYGNIGDVATIQNQDGVYVTLQLGF